MVQGRLLRPAPTVARAATGTFPPAATRNPSRSPAAPTPNTAVYQQAFPQGPADITQAGGLSPYGVMGLGGNAWEWEETNFDLMNDDGSSIRGVRGGHWSISSSLLSASIRNRGLAFPAVESDGIGFRVASVPEPSSGFLGALTTLGLLQWRRRVR